jgi:hypothetical protein
MYIQNSVGTDRITFTSGGNAYYNLATLWSLTDYFDIKDNYTFTKLKSVSFEITRTVDEATMIDSCNGGIWLLYNPSISNTVVTKADLIRNQASYQIDLMTFDKQTVVIPFSDIQVPANSGVLVGDYITINNAVPMGINLVQYIQGQLSMASDNTKNGVQANRLFSVIVRFHVEMYYRL